MTIICTHACQSVLRTPQTILEYGKQNGISRLVLTDLYWDENVSGPGNSIYTYAYISQAPPLPQENVRFHFGCEADPDRFLRWVCHGR